MIVKKHHSGNEFVFAGGVWVRNFTKELLAPVQLSCMFDSEEQKRLMPNEELNKNFPKISNEIIQFKKILIVSDGHDFDKRHLLISKMPKDVAVLAVNRGLARWKLMSVKVPNDQRRSINGYVINNPFDEAKACLPAKDSKYYPTCLASIRTSPSFTRKYPGDIYTYYPTRDEKFGMSVNEIYTIDDYRNPICAAIGLAFKFGVEKLMLMCCDDSFTEQRDTAVKLENGLWTYPHHLRAQEIVDANLHWLTHQEERQVKVADFSSGREYLNAAYIKTEVDALKFFLDQEEGTPND